MNKIRFLVIMVFILFSAIMYSCKKTDEKPVPDPIIPAQTFGIITRSGDKLMNGNAEFRFIGLNTPNLTVVEDNSWSAKGWHRVDTFEVRDAFKTIRLMGGSVTRTYTFSIKGGIANPNNKSHINAAGDYDEDMFKDLDMVLKLANEYKIRLIIPFIDNWDWWGGTKKFASFRGKSQADFCTDPNVIADFKNLISFVLNRTNTLTGVKYKDDPAILAWETGNELGLENAGGDAVKFDKWTDEISTYMKSIDPKHLVQDGKDCYRYGLSDAQLNMVNVDIITDHYYWGDYAAACNKSRNLCKGKKVFYVGEFNNSDQLVNEQLFSTVVANGTSGALLWSLRFHTKDGGFYFHEDPTNPANPCFRWPGFSSAKTDEVLKMEQIRMFSYIIQKLAVPAKTKPDAPTLLDGSKPDQLRWQGSAGAEYYIIERATNNNGAWTVISTHAMEDAIPYQPFADAAASSGTPYFYRIQAKNISGTSPYSNIIGPISF
jgi:hypothetical protein